MQLGTGFWGQDTRTINSHHCFLPPSRVFRENLVSSITNPHQLLCVHMTIPCPCWCTEPHARDRQRACVCVVQDPVCGAGGAQRSGTSAPILFFYPPSVRLFSSHPLTLSLFVPPHVCFPRVTCHWCWVPGPRAASHHCPVLHNVAVPRCIAPLCRAT
jgi:hypothetical protein